MRIIRFLSDDGRILLGEDQGNGEALMLIEPRAVLDADPIAASLAMIEGSSALVADDDENMRKIMATVLSTMGCRCSIAEDGQEAMRIVQTEHLDLVVTDIMMPGHDGYEIFAAARQRHGRIPVLLVTGFGYDPTHSLVRAAAEGHSAVLYKPFTPRDLRQSVCEALHDTIDAIGPFLPTGHRAGVQRVMTPLSPARVVVAGLHPPEPGEPAGTGADSDLRVMIEPAGLVVDPGQEVTFDSIEPERAVIECQADLAVIIAEQAQDVSEDDALDCVLGLTAAHRISVRPAEPKTGRASTEIHTAEAFCALGPCLLNTAALPEGSDLHLSISVDGVVTHRTTIADLRTSVRRLVRKLSRRIVLEPGMTIMAAQALGPEDCPADPVCVRSGSLVSVEIPGIGCLTNSLGPAAASLAVQSPDHGTNP